MQEVKVRMTKKRVLEKQTNDSSYILAYMLHTSTSLIKFQFPFFTEDKVKEFNNDVITSLIFNPLYYKILKDPLNKYNAHFLNYKLYEIICESIELNSIKLFLEKPQYLLISNHNLYNKSYTSLQSFYDDKKRLNLILTLYTEEYSEIFMEFENEIRF